MICWDKRNKWPGNARLMKNNCHASKGGYTPVQQDTCAKKWHTISIGLPGYKIFSEAQLDWMWNLSCSYMLKCQQLRVWKQENSLFLSISESLSRWDFKLTLVEHAKSCITSGLALPLSLSVSFSLSLSLSVNPLSFKIIVCQSHSLIHVVKLVQSILIKCLQYEYIATHWTAIIFVIKNGGYP